jgi:hypothetical protein
MFGWITGRSPEPPAPDRETAAARPAPTKVAPSPEHPLLALPPDIVSATPTNRRDASPEPDTSATAWLQQLDKILDAKSNITNKADRLADLLPTAPTNGQIEIARRLTDAIPMDDYSPARRVLTNTLLSEEVVRVLFNDVITRPDETKMPMLLELAQNDQHVLNKPARDMIALALLQSPGSNFDQWRAAFRALPPLPDAPGTGAAPPPSQ